MSITTGLLVTNSTATTSKSVSLYDMGEIENYGIKRGNNKTTLTNKQPGMGLVAERIIYSCSTPQELKIDVPLPNKVKGQGNVLYSVKLSEVVRTADGADLLVDDGVFVNITIGHNRSPYLTEAIVTEIVERAYSALIHANGDWRIDELANGDTEPTSD